MMRIAKGGACFLSLLMMLAALSPLPALAENPQGFAPPAGQAISIETADNILRARIKNAPKAAARFAVGPMSLTATSTGCASSLTQPTEIITLAASLKCDPDLIYEYVYNNIEYEPVFGSNKGPLGTLLDQRGSDFDQVQLVAALLSASGFSSGQISFKYGYIRLNGPQAASWLGVVNNAYGIGNVFYQGGVPVPSAQWISNGDGTLNRIDVAHVWMTVQIGGTNYVFDPSYKQHSVTMGLANLGTILGYSQGGFLADAGGTIDSVSISSVNRGALRSDLTTYANNLVNYLKANNPAASVNDVVGGKTIIPLTGSPIRVTTLATQSPVQPSGFPQSWGSTIPDAYRTFFVVSMPGVSPPSPCTSPSSQNIVLYTDATYGHRITIFSVPSGINFVPTLLIDGGVPPNGQNTGTAAAAGTNWSINVCIQHPYADPSAAALANQQATMTLRAGGSYLLSAGWGQVGRGMVERHRKLLAQARMAGNAPDSEVVLGESLATIGYTWLAEEAAWQRTSGDSAKISVVNQHGVGIVAQTALQAGSQGPYVDLPLNYATNYSQVPSTTTSWPPEMDAMFAGVSGFGSSLESAALEQTQALIPGMKASSTVRVVDENAATGAKTFFVDGTTTSGVQAYFNTIAPQLTGYSASDLTQIANYISTNGTISGSPKGNWMLLPTNGSVSVGNWQGWGYTVIAQLCDFTPCRLGNISQLISGNLSGGYSGTDVPTTAPSGDPTISTSTSSQMLPSSGDVSLSPVASAVASSPWNYVVAEPVDAVVGAYLYQHADLSVGNGVQPYELSFERHYSSASQETDIGLGNGWNNAFSISATRTSDPLTALGNRAPTGTSLDVSSPYAASGESSAIAAATSIAATYVAQNLLNGTLNAQKLTIAWMAQRWLTDQHTNNSVLIIWPTSSETFVMLPRYDGSGSSLYAAPSGSAVTLTGSAPDTYGNFTTFSYLNKDRSQLQFSAINGVDAGKIAIWTTPAGMALGFTYGYSYSGATYLTQVTNGLGRSLTLGYSGPHVTSVTEGNGHSVSYGYDAANNLTSYTDPIGNVTRFSYDTSGTYDAAGHLTQIFYPAIPGAFVSNWYDPVGKVNKQADANGNVSNFYLSGSRTEFIDAAGDRHITYQTARGRVLKDAWVLSGSANVFNSTAQSNGVVNIWSNQYDGQDRLVKAILPESGYTSYTWSADLNQNITQIVQTPKSGSPLSPLTTTFVYDPLYNKPTMVTDPRGLVTRNVYDAATGNLTRSVADANSFAAKSQFSYDAHGLPLTVIDPVGAVVLNAYDGFGNLTSITRDYGRLNITTAYGYDSVGNQTSVTDPNGNVVREGYDAARRLTSVTSPAAPQTLTTSYVYDTNDQLVQTSQSVDGAVLGTISASYTPSGKVATATDPNGNLIRNTYDFVDRLASVTDPVGNVTKYGYDAMSRQTGVFNTAIQAGALVTRTYRPDGPAASLADATHPATTFAYDGLDRPATTTYPGSTTETYTYDADSNILTRKTRKGDTITFTYDTLNRLATKSPPSSPVVTYGYDLLGHVISVGDTSAGITAVSATASYATSASYDALNRPINVSWTPAVAQTTPTQAGVTFTHSYDANNRRVGQMATDNSWLLYPSAAGTTGYTANNLNQYTAVGGASPTYDNNGNVTFDGTVTYCYDVEGRLTRALTAGTCASPTTTLGAYAFDAQGRRKSKTVGGATTLYVTDADDREVLEYDGASGAIQRWYAYGPGTNDVLGQMNVAAATRTTLVPDIQGSFIAAIASNAATFSKAAFLPYGENSASPSGTLRYTGSRIDPETVAASQASGLYYMRARAYSPQWGRFLQVDPIGYAGGVNLYAYAGNDPLNQTDRQGTSADGPVSGLATDGNGLSISPDQFRAGQILLGGFFAQYPDGSTQFFSTPALSVVSGLSPTQYAAAVLAGTGVGLVADGLLAVGAAEGAEALVPSTLARVIPNGIPATTLGAPGAADVFVTTPGAIEGLDAAGIAQRLSIPQSSTGYQIFQFPTPAEGLASPVFRTNPGFVGGGFTAGGAPEFVIPNGPIPAGATVTTVPF